MVCVGYFWNVVLAYKDATGRNVLWEDGDTLFFAPLSRDRFHHGGERGGKILTDCEKSTGLQVFDDVACPRNLEGGVQVIIQSQGQRRGRF